MIVHVFPQVPVPPASEIDLYSDLTPFFISQNTDAFHCVLLLSTSTTARRRDVFSPLRLTRY